MRMRSLVMAGMITILLISGICSLVLGASIPAEVHIEVTIDEFINAKNVSKEVVVTDGGVLIISLGFDPATGYSWAQAAEVSTTSVLQQIGNKVIIFEEEGYAGLSGSCTWIFKTLQRGISKINLECIQSGEDGKDVEWTFELNVIVK